MGRQISDLTGQKFGCLIALDYVGVNSQHRALWRCQCDCGAITVVRGHSLTTNPHDTCASCKNITHGHSVNCQTSRTYISWLQMKQRCYNTKHINYKYYGGKGIKVCHEWLDSFTTFLHDMGERPLSMSLDRMDGTKDYEPTNCKWSTVEEQNNNRLWS